MRKNCRPERPDVHRRRAAANLLEDEHVSLTLPEAVAGQSTTVELEAGVSPSPLTVPECPL